MRILWLRPSKGDNISVRRERIAEKLEAEDFEVVIKDAGGLDLPSAIWTTLRGDFDVIAGNVRVGLFIGYPLARLLRKPFLGDVSDPISDIDYLPELLFRFFQWYEWQILKRADAVVFVYESSYQEAIERGIDDAERLPNSVDYELFADPDELVVEEAADILHRSGVDTEKPIAIYLGVFSERYCIRDIIDAAEQTSEWEFVFVGETGLTDEVSEAAAQLENVSYPGSFPYRLMPGFLAHADVGFCFKDAEQPLKLKEYGAAGIPAIVRYGELERWYDSDELVFVEPNGEAISDALMWLKADETARRRYGEKLERRSAECSWADIANRYRELFEALGGQRD